jgi:hypothetical protein
MRVIVQVPQPEGTGEGLPSPPAQRYNGSMIELILSLAPELWRKGSFGSVNEAAPHRS